LVFVTVDFAFGHALAHDTGEFVEAAGGRVLGEVRHPLNTNDFSSFLLQAKASGSKDHRARRRRLRHHQRHQNSRGIRHYQIRPAPRSTSVNINDNSALGLQAAQGLLLTEAFYWDLNDETRAFSKHFFDRFGKMPSSTQAGNYSSTAHYLKAVRAAGTVDAKAVMAKMRELPINDFFASNGRIRIDGRMVHDMYLAQVKSPSDSKGPWDFFKILLVDLFLEAQERAPRQIILDLDATDDPLHQKAHRRTLQHRLASILWSTA
jgi:branched-chain amino acid transport system substrate-binding protein